MPYSMPNLLFNTPLHCNSPSQSPLLTNHLSSQRLFPLNALISICFPAKYFYIIIIWNIFAKETSK